MNKETVAATGIVCLTAIQVALILAGNNVVLMTSTSGLMGLIIGFYFKPILEKRLNKQ